MNEHDVDPFSTHLLSVTTISPPVYRSLKNGHQIKFTTEYHKGYNVQKYVVFWTSRFGTFGYADCDSLDEVEGWMTAIMTKLDKEST